MRRDRTIHVGYEVGTGEPVAIPARHMAVTGQTQESGKTTTLEALVSRAEGGSALAFITKRGERSFAGAPRIQPYFRDRADWQFVTSILDATLQEKNKFLRPWIMKICRTTTSLADVQRAVRKALETAKGIHEGVYTQLDAYLELIVPEIQRARLARTLDLPKDGGLRVMDLGGFSAPMQMLFVQSAIDWINDHALDTTVIVPEAWEFVPEGKGSPVKSSAITLVRKGAGIGNRIWVDSQDMAGVDKTILRGCAVWLIGVQREANEIKRNLANIPASIKRPTAAAVAELTIGQFYVCYGSHAIKTYVQPSWLTAVIAEKVAMGDVQAGRLIAEHVRITQPVEDAVNEREAQQLRDENARLRQRVEALEHQLPEQIAARRAVEARAASPDRDDDLRSPIGWDEATYTEIKRRLMAEAPAILKVMVARPAMEVEITRAVIQVDGSKPTGRIARLIAAGWFDGEGKTQGATRAQLARTGSDVNSGNISTIFSGLVKDGFLTAEANNLYRSVQGMKVNIIER